MVRRYSAMAAVGCATLALSIPFFAHALPAQIVPQSCNDPGGCHSICDLATLVNNLFIWGMIAFMTFFGGLLVIDFVRLMAARGNEVRLAEAKKRLSWWLAGLFVVFMAYPVANVAMNYAVNGSVSAAPWNRLCSGPSA